MPYAIDFDAANDRLNRAKHNISLQRASEFDWDGAISFEDTRQDYGEERFVAVGRLDRKLYVAVYTVRGDTAVSSAYARQTAKNEPSIFPGDEDSPKLTAEMLARAKPLRLSHPELYAAAQRRAADEAPTRTTVTIDADVLLRLRADGPGWQRRLNAALREHFGLPARP